MKVFKIAVCLSGQPRFWKFSAANIKKYFSFDVPHVPSGLPIETDYFIHTWDTNTWRQPKKSREFYINEKHNDFEAIIDEYNPKKSQLDKFDESQFSMAWDPLFYSFEKSIFLKRQYELEHDFEYDIVIKARLDIMYNPTTRFPVHDPIFPKQCYTSHPIMNFPSEFNYWNFDDVIFFGNSATMDLMGLVYKTHQIKFWRHKKIYDFNLKIEFDPVKNWYGPGAILYDHMVNLGIHPNYSRQYIEYVVARDTMIDKKLNPMNEYDFQKLIKIGRDWYI